MPQAQRGVAAVVVRSPFMSIEGALFGLGLLALRTLRRRRPPAAVTPIQSSK